MPFTHFGAKVLVILWTCVCAKGRPVGKYNGANVVAVMLLSSGE